MAIVADRPALAGLLLTGLQWNCGRVCGARANTTMALQFTDFLAGGTGMAEDVNTAICMA